MAPLIILNINRGANASISKAVLLNDGKLLLGGSFSSFNGSNVGRVVKLNSDGSLDPGFKAPSSFNQAFSNDVWSIVPLSDGKIIISLAFSNL